MSFARFIIIALLFIASPVLAAGNLTITGISSAPSFVNTNQSYLMLNLSMNATVGAGDGKVNITSINITVGNVEVPKSIVGNISAVEIWNSTGSVIGANTTNLTDTKFRIFIPTGLLVNSTANTTISIYFNISVLSNRFANITANISLTADIGTDSALNNISIVDDTITSTLAQIQDVHAVASVTPKFVDTGVIQQILQYTINVTGADTVNKTDILLPGGYTIVNWINITRVGSIDTTYTQVSASVTVAYNATRLNISYGAGHLLSKGDNVTIRFVVDTNSSAVSSKALDSKLWGGNLSNIATYDSNSSTNVTTKQLIIVQNVSAIKNAAIVNGSDYWEFNFTLNFTANVSGLLQFKMNNWSSTEGYMINLSNQTGLFNATYYATFRESGNSSNYMNATNNYTSTESVDSTGVSLTTNTNNMYSIILKMIIPSRTPSSLTWYTRYWMLFRPTP